MAVTCVHLARLLRQYVDGGPHALSSLSVRVVTTWLLAEPPLRPAVVVVAERMELPDGSDSLFTILGKEEERTLVRESTAGFAGMPMNTMLYNYLSEPLAQ